MKPRAFGRFSFDPYAAFFMILFAVFTAVGVLFFFGVF
jgi:hypothetical protein